MIGRSPGRNDWELSKFVYTASSWQAKRSISSGLDYPSLIQEFLYPKGNHACLSRICYKTKHYQGLDRSYGFRIRNKIKLTDNSSKYSQAQKASICKDQMDSFEIYTLKYGVVEEFGVIAQRLVDFLERALRLRITEIVLDFITDQNNQHWMFNMKSLRVVYPNKEVSRALQEKRENKNELSCSVYCKLCGLIFKKDEASKTLTYKLLWEFARHLKKRGGKLKNLDLNHSSTRPCRVCDLCYMVVVSEHELIELEQQFALAQNVPIKDPFIRVPLEKKAKHRPALLNEILNQWRLMIFAQTLSFEKENDNIQKMGLLNQTIFFQIKLANIKSVFQIILKNKEERFGRNFYQMKILRIFYFFSETENIAKFLEDSEIQMRLTYTQDFNNYIAHGSTRSFRNFQNERISGQKHSATLYMFFDDTSIGTLNCMFGLVCDGSHDTGSMNLYKSNGIYFPNQDFYNCNIFPLEWLEVFAENGKLSLETHDDKEDSSENNIQQKYTPFCSGNELRKMLEGKVRIRSNNLKGTIISKYTISKKNDFKVKSTNKIISTKKLPKIEASPKMVLNKMENEGYDDKRKISLLKSRKETNLNMSKLKNDDVVGKKEDKENSQNHIFSKFSRDHILSPESKSDSHNSFQHDDVSDNLSNFSHNDSLNNKKEEKQIKNLISEFEEKFTVIESNKSVVPNKKQDTLLENSIEYSDQGDI